MSARNAVYGTFVWPYLAVRDVRFCRTVGLVPRGLVFSSVRTRTLAVQVHGTARTVATAAVSQWRAGTVVRCRGGGTVVVAIVRGRFRGTEWRHRVFFGRNSSGPVHRNRLIVHDVVGQHRLVVHEVHRRGGHRGRRGRVVDQRRFESGGRRSGTQHEAHHRYGKVKREQDELSVKSERQ